MRHPIYSGTFLSLLAFLLRGFSVPNLAVATILIGLLMIRSVVAERFLREDASYATYFQEVRWRWFPGIA